MSDSRDPDWTGSDLLESPERRDGPPDDDGERDAVPGDTGQADDDHPGVFGEAAPATPIEPGSPSIENAAFVLLGVASTIGLVIHLASLV